MKFDLTEVARKVKEFQHVRMEKAQDEIACLEMRLRTSPHQMRDVSSHKVIVRGEEYIATDAKYLNREANQRGRGNYRYLFQQAEFAGVAVHTPAGDYRMLYRAA